MEFDPKIKRWQEGSNEEIEYTGPEGQERYSLAVVDDLEVASIEAQLEKQQVSIICTDTKNRRSIKFNFYKVVNLKFQPQNTFETYNTHDETTNLTVIDQIIYDPRAVESKLNITFVGLGWVLAMNAKRVELELEAEQN